jgi:hypothetical protein
MLNTALNLTLTITAAPELLAVLSNFTVPEAMPSYISSKASQEQFEPEASYNQSISIPVNALQAPQQAPVHTPPVQTYAVPTTLQTYTMEQLAVAATVIVDAGRRPELVSLLNSFGVQALTELPKEQYGAFAIKLRGLGVNI